MDAIRDLVLRKVRGALCEHPHIVTEIAKRHCLIDRDLRRSTRRIAMMRNGSDQDFHGLRVKANGRLMFETLRCGHRSGKKERRLEFRSERRWQYVKQDRLRNRS